MRRICSFFGNFLFIYVEENHLFGGGYAKISTDDRGLYFFTEGRRPEVKKYNPRSEVYHLCIYTDKEVVFLHNYDYYPPPLPPFFLPRKSPFLKLLINRFVFRPL